MIRIMSKATQQLVIIMRIVIGYQHFTMMAPVQNGNARAISRFVFLFIENALKESKLNLNVTQLREKFNEKNYYFIS